MSKSGPSLVAVSSMELSIWRPYALRSTVASRMPRLGCGG